MANSSKKRGSTLIEFSLVGIPLILISTSVLTAAIDMWQFHNIAYATQSTARFIAMHGRSCTQNGSTCTVTVSDIVSFFASHAIALDPARTKLVLTSASATTTCNPMTSCSGITDQFPNATDNGVNFDVVATATYPVTSPIFMFWPGGGVTGGSTFNLFAISRQRIIY